jgi:DNA-binding CsgD family transcriptional regulator
MEDDSLKASSPLWPDLTARERQILYPVLEGKPNKLIASELGISMRTVESHRASLFCKMGVKNAVQLACTLYSQHGSVRAAAASAADTANATHSSSVQGAHRQTGAAVLSSSAIGSRSG